MVVRYQPSPRSARALGEFQRRALVRGRPLVELQRRMAARAEGLRRLAELAREGSPWR